MTSEGHRIFLSHIDDPPVHLSSTNNPPSDSETSQLRRSLDRGRVYLIHLQDEINRLQKAMDAVYMERWDIQSKVDRHAAILSPMRRLPPEILSAIFQWTLPLPNARPAFVTQSPWNISRVCGRWRAICLASPHLWSHISIQSTRHFPSDALLAQLERSRPRPLSIHFSFEGINPNMKTLGLLLATSGRWETIWLLRPPKTTILRFNTLTSPSGRPPIMLRTLTFKRSDDSETCTAFAAAPLLTDVRIDGSHRRLLVPYPQLKRLRVQMPRTPDRLVTATALTHLTLGKASASLPPPSYPTPVRLPRVRALFVADGRYLESLLLPALEDVCVQANAQFLPNFIERSECALRRLTVLEPMLDAGPVLACTPALRELRLNRLFGVGILAECLAVPEPDGPVGMVCPELRRVALCDVDEDEFRILLGLLDARKRSVERPSLSLTIFALNPENSGLTWNVNSLLALESASASVSATPTSTQEHTEPPSLYPFPEAYKDLKTHVEWVVGKRAVERLEGWRTSYPGGGK